MDAGSCDVGTLDIPGDITGDVERVEVGVRFRRSERADGDPSGSRLSQLGVRDAEVRELTQQVIVRPEAGRRGLAVGEPGEAHAVNVVGEGAPVGLSG